VSRQRELRRRQQVAERKVAQVAGSAAAARRRRLLIRGGISALVVLAVAVPSAWFFWPRSQPVVLERVYHGDACMLTGSAGINTPTSSAAWAGVRAGATKRGARASFFTVSGPQTQAQARPMLASLLQRKCSVIVAVGSVPAAVARAGASKASSVTFVLVEDGAATSAGSNVLTVATADRPALTSTITADVSAHVRT
jgi:hypothetical protein